MAHDNAALLNRLLLEHHALPVNDLRDYGVPQRTVTRYIASGLLISLAKGIVGLAADPDPWASTVAGSCHPIIARVSADCR